MLNRDVRKQILHSSFFILHLKGLPLQSHGKSKSTDSWCRACGKHVRTAVEEAEHRLLIDRSGRISTRQDLWRRTDTPFLPIAQQPAADFSLRLQQRKPIEAAGRRQTSVRPAHEAGATHREAPRVRCPAATGIPE